MSNPNSKVNSKVIKSLGVGSPTPTGFSFINSAYYLPQTKNIF